MNANCDVEKLINDLEDVKKEVASCYQQIELIIKILEDAVVSAKCNWDDCCYEKNRSGNDDASNQVAAAIKMLVGLYNHADSVLDILHPRDQERALLEYGSYLDRLQSESKAFMTEHEAANSVLQAMEIAIANASASPVDPYSDTYQPVLRAVGSRYLQLLNLIDEILEEVRTPSKLSVFDQEQAVRPTAQRRSSPLHILVTQTTGLGVEYNTTTLPGASRVPSGMSQEPPEFGKGTLTH